MITEFSYTLGFSQRVNWTKTQEKSLTHDFPFELEQETDEQYVVRTYLQFLWLPESIMPLSLLIPSFLRVSATDTPHPLHSLLKPLLLTARSASAKYHVELPQVLKNGGAAGEIEETMMWYALNHERADDDLWTRTSATGEGPWVDDTWRMKWIERMERREFQIQILLYFLKLSLPGPPPESPTKKKRRPLKDAAATHILSDEERLEAFMDKMSMWQLVNGLESADMKVTTKDGEHDWMQCFFEDTVSPQFQSKLPEACTLFRTKIFPHSLFSSSPASSSQTSPTSSCASSPEVPNNTEHFSRAGSSRLPSPALSSQGPKLKPLARSRSLSVSLAQERERERERSVGLVGTKKRALNREVSMSRVFKPKAKAPDNSEARKRGAAQDVLPKAKVKDEAITLVAATPVKAKAKSKSTSQPTIDDGGISMNRRGSILQPIQGEDDDDDDVWNLPSSPDILLLGGHGGTIGEGRASPGAYDSDTTPLETDPPLKRLRLK